LISKKKDRKKFLVLVPHRDVRQEMRKYSASLFTAGFPGAFCFPWAAPLAALSQALNEEELKHFSRVLREIIGSKLYADKAAVCALEKETLFGPLIDIGDFSGAPGNAAEKVTKIFPHPVIGSCLLTSCAESADLPAPPQLSFSAAAVANMHWTRTDEGGAFSVKWKIGKLFWLPAARSGVKK